MRLLRPSPGAITSPFGRRPKPTAGASTHHQGVDFGWGNGWTISAAADGHVVFAGRSGGYGNLTKIRHRDGIETWYAHASEIYVRAGQYVTAGLAIAKIGNTGISTGPHLHFEYRISGAPVDPVPYFSAPAGEKPAPIEPIIEQPKRKKKTMYLFWTTDGSGHLAAGAGTAPIPSQQIYNLFFRLINSDQGLSPFYAADGMHNFVPGKYGQPQVFNAVERDLMAQQLRLCTLQAQTGVTIEHDKLVSALRDALGGQTVGDVTDAQLAAALDTAIPRIAAAVRKQIIKD